MDAVSERVLYEKFGEYFGLIKSLREAEIAALDDVLSYLYREAVGEYDCSQIQWESVEGPRGPYERASEDSVDFGLLVKDLEAHEGRLTLDNSFYWLFGDGQTVGRKSR